MLTDEEKVDYRGNGGDGEAGAAAERQDGGDTELRNTIEREIDEVVINAFSDALASLALMIVFLTH